MFDNVGRTIKILSKVLLSVGVGLSFLFWFILLIRGVADEQNNIITLSFAVLVFGALGSWITSILLYGFGSLIENSKKR